MNHDWSHGLPLLARSSDATLKELASLDLRGATTTQVCMTIGNRYWDVAAKDQEPAHSAFQSRAEYWYSKALPQLEGLEKVLAEKRIEEANKPSIGRATNIASGATGHLYERFDAAVGWHVAKLLCTQARGHLIIIPSEEVQVLANKLAADRNVWLGATDEEKQGEWHWLNGSPLGYSHWGPGQPDNHGGGQHWVHMYRGDPTGPWDDTEETQHVSFICEWDN